MTFRLRTLFVAVGLSGVMLYLLVAAPGLIATLGLMLYSTLSMSFLFAGAGYAGANLKAFCRGALVPMLLNFSIVSYLIFPGVFEVLVGEYSQWLEFGDRAAGFLRRWTINWTVLSVWMGLTTLGFKRLVEPRSPTGET